MPRFVYSSHYYCDLGHHVFRTEKYRLLHDLIVEGGLAAPDEFLAPEPATREDVLLVHTPEYLDDLLAARPTSRTALSEMPISREIIGAFMLGAGGTILACRSAIREHEFAMNLAGGFHHAMPDRAEGFCYINDVAVGVRRVREDGLARRVMIVDCDLHQGNGTAVIFAHEPEVFTFSIHEEAIYPLKQRSDLDVGLPSFCAGEQYLRRLAARLPDALDRHEPDFVLYVAGADPYADDLLGTLMLSIQDLWRRDQAVLGACAERGIPAAVTLAGGYSPDVRDTARIHYGTARAMCELSERLAAPSHG